MNPHRRFLEQLLENLQFAAEKLDGVVEDVERRIERIDGGENPTGVVTGLVPVLQDFMESVRDVPPSDLPDVP